MKKDIRYYLNLFEYSKSGFVTVFKILNIPIYERVGKVFAIFHVFVFKGK